MNLLDSRTLIRIMRELEPGLAGAEAFRYFLMVEENVWDRLVGGNKGNAYWPEHRSWVRNAESFLVEPKDVEELAGRLAVMPLKDCFATDEDEITTLEDRFQLLLDVVLDRCGAPDYVKRKIAVLLRDLDVDPAEAERIGSIGDLSGLSEYLVSRARNKGRDSGADQRNRRKPSRKQRPKALSDVDVNILPDVVLQERWNHTRFTYREDGGSPLAQILQEREEQRFFLLYGEEDSAVSGAGKTTSLRVLAAEAGGDAVFVPLCDVYNAFGLRKCGKKDGASRIFSWLERQGCPAEKGSLLLLDGLEEITGHEGLQAFCDDLTELVWDGQYRLVLSCVVPPERLPGWRDLEDISTVLTKFLPCRLQPMTPEQRQTCLGDREPAGFPQVITTPYLLSLCRNVNRAAEEQKSLFFRWVSGELPIRHGSSLFFRSLAAQICSWFRTDPGNDRQSERDSFMLMFALPAVAFHMVLGEVYDANYSPEIRAVDGETVQRLLALAFPIYKRGLKNYIPYGGESKAALSVLADSMRKIDTEELLSEKTGAVLNRSFDPETMEYTYRFANRAVRDGLAALHLANLFCAAGEGLLPTGAEFDEFYICPVRFLPHALLESAAVLVEERMQEQGCVEWLLESGETQTCGGQDEFCRYLSCSLAAAFCTALRLKAEQHWRAGAQQAYELLLAKNPRLAEQYEMDHAVNCCTQSGLLRRQGKYPAAAEQAGAAIRFVQSRRLLNADGYQSLAMLYLTQVKDGLNMTRPWEDYGIGIPGADLARACEIYEELQRLAPLSESGPQESEVFGALPAESVLLTPDCLCLLERAKLRLDAYEKEKFFGSKELEFLLTASFAAKAHSVWAALCPAASGAALNLLAGFFENDQERMEHDPELPFFTAHPEFHLSIDPERLSYPEKDCSAARLYLRIIHLRRGLQPYSCRNLAQSLLSRRFRLDGNGRPIPADGAEREFSKVESEFLDEITRRACSRLRPTYAIPRIRYLNYRIDALGEQEGREQMAAWDREEAGALFRHEWKQGNCGEKLDSRTEKEADLLAVMLAGLYREDYLPDADPVSWTAKINDYHFRCKSAAKIYTIGESFR